MMSRPSPCFALSCPFLALFCHFCLFAPSDLWGSVPVTKFPGHENELPGLGCLGCLGCLILGLSVVLRYSPGAQSGLGLGTPHQTPPAPLANGTAASGIFAPLHGSTAPSASTGPCNCASASANANARPFLRRLPSPVCRARLKVSLTDTQGFWRWNNNNNNNSNDM
jgi:hypothetical protein